MSHAHSLFAEKSTRRKHKDRCPRIRSVCVLLLAFSLFYSDGLAQGKNKKPRITGQDALLVTEDQSITILMSYLTVEDPDDWFYPWGFTMQIYPGDNYTFQGHVVTPAPDFHGTLKVKVTVHDGVDESNKFDLEISVTPVNDKPVITGHSALSVDEGQSITLLLDHLKVSDPDNAYPRDFRLTVHNGDHYTVNGNQITALAGFSGQLSVNVSVSDGDLQSDVYALPVAVKAIDRVPEIIGQATLQMNEDQSLTILLSHLTVTDGDSSYPTGFSLSVAAGENYAVNGSTVTPAKDYFGRLSVPVTVNDGKNTSKPFNVVIVVTPVNDMPVITDLETEPVQYSATSTSVPVTETAKVGEADGDSIMFAEVGFRMETYQNGIDKLAYVAPPGSKIRGVFDAASGILTLLGQASPESYAAAIRAIRYECMMPSRDITKTIFFSVNDGKENSQEVVRQIIFGKVAVSLDIPSGFTPNGDMANDTWKIIPLKSEEEYAKAQIRVYNKEGIMVYEAIGFEHEWDGRYNGELLPADTYFYTIDLKILAPEGYVKGVVTILR